MKDGALFRHDDLLAAERRVNTPAQAAALGKLHQPSNRPVGDAVRRIVEVDAGGPDRDTLATPGIVGEELPQMLMAHRVVMCLQRPPRGARGERLRLFSRRDDHCHFLVA